MVMLCGQRCSAIGIGFNGAETNCRIAHILGILLMNSCNTDRFLATTIICSLSTLKCMYVQNFFQPFQLIMAYLSLHFRGVGGNLILHVTSVAAGCCREERHLKGENFLVHFLLDKIFLLLLHYA